MNRTITKKNKPSYKVITFWSIISLLTLFFLIFVVYKFVENKNNVDDLDDLTNLSGQQIFTQKGDYYVLVYSKVGVTQAKDELDKLTDLEDSIFNYLTYVKRNPETSKMYGMIVDSYENYSCLIENGTTDVNNKTNFANIRINKSEIPLLLKVSNGKIISSFISENDIREELQKTIIS